VSPECGTGFVVGEEEDVASADALGGECAEARFDELSAEAAVAEFGGNGEVMEIAAAAIVAAEDGGDDSLFVAGDETQAGVAGDIVGELLRCVGLVEADAFGGRPESEDVL
jgi:hypothetical protein